MVQWAAVAVPDEGAVGEIWIYMKDEAGLQANRRR